MSFRSFKLFKRTLVLGILTVMAALASSDISRAEDVVLQGADLLATRSGTRINLNDNDSLSAQGSVSQLELTPFIGVPLGTFDFGNGPVATFNTDTIIRRLSRTTGRVSIVHFEVRALQWRSENPINLGWGLDYHYVTLQKPSSGTMIIEDSGEPGPPPNHFHPQPVHGTFDSTISLPVYIKKGGLDGPIVQSLTLVLNIVKTHWSHYPLPETGNMDKANVLIPFINFLLNFHTHDNDFFPIGEWDAASPDGTRHRVRLAQMP